MRNPPWTRDELILALDLYRRSGDRMPGQTSAEVAALSRSLSQIGAALGGERRADYRNANGVYMKLMNFRRFDPQFYCRRQTWAGTGQQGRGARLE